jgi:hypothetical protein
MVDDASLSSLIIIVGRSGRILDRYDSRKRFAGKKLNINPRAIQERFVRRVVSPGGILAVFPRDPHARQNSALALLRPQSAAIAAHR